MQKIYKTKKINIKKTIISGIQNEKMNNEKNISNGKRKDNMTAFKKNIYFYFHSSKMFLFYFFYFFFHNTLPTYDKNLSLKENSN